MIGKKWLAGAALGAVLALAVGVAMAGEDGTAGPSFLDRVAEKLGIGTDELEQAIRDARSDEIDAAVERGDLTPEEAERLKERLDEIPGDAPFGPGPKRHKEDFGFWFGGPPRGGGHKPFLAPALGLFQAGERIAEFLGISEEQLREELAAEGATLATVAEAHGKSRDELKAFLEGEARARLDELVADGHIEQAAADKMLERFREHLDAVIDAEMPPFIGPVLRGFRWHHGHDGGHDGGRDDGEDPDESTPQEQSQQS